MIKGIALLLASLLVAVFSAGTPSQQSPNAADADQQRTAMPDKTQTEKAERAEKALNKMEKYVEVKITPVAYSDEAQDYIPTKTFKVGGETVVAVLMTNRSDQALNAFNLGRFRHHRLRLMKDGMPVRYLSDVPLKLKAVETNVGVVVSTHEVTLAPNVETNFTQLNLQDWYGTLQPGHYELTLRHRFRQSGKQVESNTVTFDVVP